MLQVVLIRGIWATRSTTLGYGRDAAEAGWGARGGWAGNSAGLHVRPYSGQRNGSAPRPRPCSRTSQEPWGFATGFPYFGTAAHLFERALDAHCVPGRDKSPALAELRLRNGPENYGPQAKSRQHLIFFCSYLLFFSNSFIEI